MNFQTTFATVLALGLCLPEVACAEQTLFTKVNVFDGTSESLKSQDVLVEDNLINLGITQLADGADAVRAAV